MVDELKFIKDCCLSTLLACTTYFINTHPVYNLINCFTKCTKESCLGLIMFFWPPTPPSHLDANAGGQYKSEDMIYHNTKAKSSQINFFFIFLFCTKTSLSTKIMSETKKREKKL